MEMPREEEDNTKEVKARENRLRRMAKRQELILIKSRRRDWRAPDYGTYILADYNNWLVSGERCSLDDIEELLTTWSTS